MATEFLVLAAVAFSLAYAILDGRETGILAAVLAYAAVVTWIIQSHLTLLMMALGLGIILAVVGLVAVVSREMLSQEDTWRHTSNKIKNNNRRAMENIGS